jgi:hypothetical protein
MGGTDRSTGVSRETRRGGGFGPREKQHPRGANSVAVTRGFRGPGMHMTRCPRRTDPRWFVSFLFLSFFWFFLFVSTFQPWRLWRVGMDSDRIRTDTNADVTIYHILFRIRIQIQILSNTNTKWIFRIWIHIRIVTRFTA